MSQKIKVLFLVLFLVLLTNCSKDSDSSKTGNGQTQQGQGTGFMDPRPTLAGPSLTGHWASACAANSQIIPQTVTPVPPFRQFDFVISGSLVTRTTIFFEDAACTNESLRYVYKGKFRFIDQFSDNSYLTEYAFDTDQGATTYPKENILVAINQFFISNFAEGSGALLLNAEPLVFVGP